jgi:aspartokinase-like uncharacterized kinase
MVADVAIDCVVKVGGSLYDLPDLADRLRAFLAGLQGRSFIVVPGGGATADVIRAFDACHRLGEEASHWLALRALTLNAHFLAEILGRARVVGDGDQALAAWQAGDIPILDAHAFAQHDRGEAGETPHSWEATSDALAARLTGVVGAKELILLKSVNADGDLLRAVERGVVDQYVSQLLPAGVSVRVLNLRENLQECKSMVNE